MGRRALEHLPARRLSGGLRVAHALRARDRLRGLAGLDELDPDAALHLARCRSVHTAGMRFAVDLIWLDARGAVVRIDRDVGPGRLRTCPRARSVVETRAGRAQAFLDAGV